MIEANSDRERLRATFDEVAELYDRARPVYPRELFADLVSLAAHEPRARVLEIGCGTGQATAPLAELGFDLVCVELGERLAEVARRRLARFPNVEVVSGDFEQWEAPAASFDAVVAFTAFHWIDPAVRYEKAARLLRPGGALAVVSTQHVLAEGGDPFFAEVQKDYEAVDPTADSLPPPAPDEAGDLAAEIEASGLFRSTAVRRYLWDVTYSADEYIAVLDTYSGHRSLGEERRRRLYDLIRHRIEARPGATIRKTYLAMLHVAERS